MPLGLDAYVKLLLHCNGSDGDTSFTDSSSGGKTVTTNGKAIVSSSLDGKGLFGAGDAKISNTKSKFGSYSLSLDGNGDYIGFPDSADFDFGSGNFTIDFWVYFNNLSGYKGILSQRSAYNSNHSYTLQMNGNKMEWNYTTNGSTQQTTTFAKTFSTGQWYHIAIVRNSTTLTLYVDGTADATTCNISTNTIYNSAQNLYIGAISQTGIGDFLNAYVDEFRVSKGVARWTGNFTAPIAAYTTDSYTKLLLHFDGTNDSKVIVDSSASNTIAGKFSQGVRVFNRGNSYNADYLSLADSEDWNFGTGDFTIDFWFCANRLPNYDGVNGDYVGLYGQRSSYTTKNHIATFLTTSGGLSLYTEFTYDGTTQQTIKEAFSFVINTWYHIALVRNGTTITQYVNGVAKGNKNVGANALYNSDQPFTIGGAYNSGGFGHGFDGLIDEFRVSKGVARWTADFTPPTDEYYEGNPPVASNVYITGNPNVGQTLTGHYTYTDNESDPEGTSTFRWLRDDVAIVGETAITYLLVEADFETVIKFEVTPISTLPPTDGVAVESAGLTIGGVVAETHTPIIEILQYIGVGAIESCAAETMTLAANHGLVAGDFFVDRTVRDLNGIYGTERGSRKVASITGLDTLNYNSNLADANVTDEILLFKFTDITQYLLQKTLTITKKASHSNTANFSLFIPVVDDAIPFQPHPAQLIRITLDDEIRFLGMIADLTLTAVNEVHPYVYMDIQCIGLKGIPARRTITVAYAADDTAGEIVTAINDGILIQEGFEPASPTYISTGDEIGNAWNNDTITIAEVLDELAMKNGYQWFVDDDFQLHFYQDPVTVADAPYNLDESGLLRYKKLRLTHSIDGYVNRNFVVGGNDMDGNQIRTVNLKLRSDAYLTEQNYIQEITGGTGVWGNVLRDSGISRVLYRAAENGTGLLNIEITAHGMSVGDYVYNATLDETTFIDTISDENNFLVDSSASAQTEGDIIVTYPSADDASQNILKRQGYIPKIVEYTIDHIFMEPQMKQVIELPRSGIVEGTYSIDSVVIRSMGAGLFESDIVAVLRDADDFSTQSKTVYKDYFKSITKNRPGFGNNLASINTPRHIGDTAPTNPVNGHLWLDTSDKTWYYYDLATTSWI